MQKLAQKARLTPQAATNRGCHTLLTDHTGLGNSKPHWCRALPAFQTTSSKALEWQPPQGRQPKDWLNGRADMITDDRLVTPGHSLPALL
jgi:hypothetical protein